MPPTAKNRRQEQKLELICGLDFGTSNCSLGVWSGDAPVLLPISAGGPYMPSVAYVARREYASVPIDETALNRRVAAALKEESVRRTNALKQGLPYKGLTGQQLEDRERSLLRQEIVAESEQKYSSQSLYDAIVHADGLLFGEAAIRANNDSPGEGFYFKSPKLFLGTELHSTHLDIFRRIISEMIAEVRDRAQTHLGHELRQVAIGHPVRYKLGNGESGNRQALEVMTAAALDAGFGEVVFLQEPFAAALDYELACTRDEVVLVVDVGGGTTDCAVIQVGPGRTAQPSRNNDVLSYAGDRIGGVDMDFLFTWHSIMPWLGKDQLTRSGLPIPHAVLIEAISVNNIPAQERFRNAQGAILSMLSSVEDTRGLARLYNLWQQGLQFRLVRSAETAKIELSHREQTNLSLRYLDSELEFAVSQGDFMEAVEVKLSRIGELAREAVKAASTKVDKIFLTGGTSRSPAVVQRIMQAIGPDIPVVRGDDLGSVALGLTRFARGVFR